MQRSVVETIIGAVVLAVAGFFLYFTYSSGYQRVDGYDVMAKFNRVDGLVAGQRRAPQRHRGRQGRQGTDRSGHLSRHHPSAHRQQDQAAGGYRRQDHRRWLLGSNYVALEPGGDEKMIADGGEITATQDPVNIVDLVGRFIFGGPGNGKAPSGPNQSTTNPPQPTPTQTDLALAARGA